MSKVVLSLGLSKKPPTKTNKVSVLQSNAREDADPDGEVKVDFIKRVDGKEIDNGEPVNATVLSIPLTEDPWAKASAQSADDEAVAALLGEASSSNQEDGEVAPPAIRAIEMVGNTSAGSGPARPILQAAMIPGLEDLKDDNEKFKHDIAVRAADIQVNSECYSTVPIVDFGEALLRGMGWDGSRAEEEKKAAAQARPSRLGLGAKERPPSPGAEKEKAQRIKKQQQQPETRDQRNQAVGNEWAKEAARKLAKQRLEVGQVVWLKDSRFVVKGDVSRAKVLRTSGVPGLNQVEIQLEASGEVTTVSRGDAVLVGADELEDKPYAGAAAARPPSQKNKRERPDPSSCSSSKGVGEGSGGNNSGNHLESSSSSKRRRDEEKQSSSSSSSHSRARPSSDSLWVMPSIRVRIIQQGNKHHREKADVFEVDGDDRVSVKLDSGKRVYDLREKDLETVVPSVGEKVRVVRGEHRKRKCVILKKDRDREEVCVELDGRKEYLKFDDVSARAD